mgnify:FL=1
MSAFTDACTAAMLELARDPRVIFLGQNVCYPGHTIYDTLRGIPDDRKIELPVFEDTQMGISTGLALAGFVPVTCYPRIYFLLMAMNKLVLHLDKLGKMSQGQLQPKVIVRTMLGANYPLDPGPQHNGNYVHSLRQMLTYTPVMVAATPEAVPGVYRQAMGLECPVVVVEIDQDKRSEYR